MPTEADVRISHLDASMPGGRSSPLSLRANFSWTFVGNIVYAGCQWGMLVALVKFGTPEMVGQFALALAVTAPVILFANLSLRAVQATDARQDYRFSDYLGLRLITTVLALGVIVGIATLGSYRPETSAIIITVGLSKGFESLSDIYYGLFQQRERMDRIAKSMMIKGPISLMVLGLAICLTGSVFWGTVGLAVVWALLLVIYDMRSARLIVGNDPTVSLRPEWKIGVLRQLIWLALPLGAVMLLISLNANIPRYVIEQTGGEALLGYYAAMAYLMVVGRTIVAALGQSAVARLSQHYATQNNQAFVRLLLRLIGIGAALGLSGVLTAILIGKQVLTLLYTSEYAAYSDVFILLMVAAGLGYVGSFLGYAVTATRAFHRFLLPYSLVTLSILLSSVLLIPDLGLIGAAWAVCIGSIVNCAVPVMLLVSIFRRREHEPA